jgi:hypothetical protein
MICAKRQLSMPVELGGLNVPSFELNVEPPPYAQFIVTLANVMNDYESESLGPMYGLIRKNYCMLLLLPYFGLWAVQSLNSYDTISNMGRFSELELAVLMTSALNQYLSDFVGPDVELLVSPVDNIAAASATQLTYLQLKTPESLSRSGNFGGHIQWPGGILRILRARAYLYLMAFCKPSPPDYTRVISDAGRGALALFLRFT